jgi:hypothetical protein
MWRNDKQRLAACKALLAPLRLDHLWTYESEENGGAPGPTAEGMEKYHAEGTTLSHGERIMFDASWVLWNGGRDGRRPNLDEILYALDGTNLRLLGTFLTAFASPRGQAIDLWIAENPERSHK